MTRARLIVAGLLALGVACASFASSSAGAGDEQRYRVVLDNAFGLTEGADLRAAGVRVGKVESLDVQRSTARALVTIVVTRPDFAGFRADVFCEVKPQSLIGEYFLDCEPGSKPGPAPATIPVQQTAGTIPPDLVFDILRRPARERFGLILTELGIGLTARGEDVQTTIRRGVPALRETDRVLAILNANRGTLQQLTRDADTVLAELARNRRDVGRFVREAGETTAASAARADALATTVNRLPGFLRELRPTLADLGTAAEQQTPALRDLRRAAPDLTTLLRRLGPFADSARPAVRGLGKVSRTGIPAVREARSTVKQLRALGTMATEPMRNLRFVLEDIDDRERAVERNRLSPTGAGFTGLEALLQYFFVQSQAINIYDSKGFMLKLGVLINECSQYTNAEHAITAPERTHNCRQWLGPNQPGIVGGTVTRDTGSERSAGSTPQPAPATGTPAPSGPATGTPAPASPPPPPAPLDDARELLDNLLPEVTERLPELLPRRGASPRSAPSAAPSAASERNLLDYLLGP